VLKGLKRGARLSSLAITGAVLLTVPAGAADVSNNTITNGAVTTAKMANGAITTDKLAVNSVSRGAIRNGAINTDKLAAGSVTTSALADGAVTGAKIAFNTNIGLGATRTTSDTGSFQTLAGDVTYEGNAGGNSFYHSGVMGNFFGDDLANTTASLHAGVIGSYNVTTADANPGSQAGVIGEVGEAAVGTGTAAIMAVLGGDSAVLTADAAYGVQYFNSDSGSHFNYGLDLYHAETDGFTNSAVDYGVADIRLASGATISSGSATPGTCVTGSLFLDTDGGANATLWACTATNTWTAVSNLPS
jgi:hypothetical protein